MSTDAEQARREKAEAWAKSKLPRLIEYQNEQDGENYGMADAWNADDVAAEMEDAYLAGHRDASEEAAREIEVEVDRMASGGWLVPLRTHWMLRDLAARLARSLNLSR